MPSFFPRDATEVKVAIETMSVIGLWLVSNISIMNITKWVYEYGTICVAGQAATANMDATPTCRTFEFPLAITTLHMVCSWAFCYIYIFMIRSAPPKRQLYGWERFRKVGPLAACFAASVAMGNLSLEFIFPSFSQMVSSASPLITFSMAIAFTGAKHNLGTWLAMIPICGGMIVCAKNEANFSTIGAALVLGSTILRSAKSIIQGEILSSAEEKLDSATLLYYMSPYAAVMLLLSSLAMEGAAPYTLLLQGAGVHVHGLPAGTGSAKVVALVLISGVNAFVLNISTFLVTAYTSAVMLQVLGNVKSAVGILISVLIFGNPLSRLQAAGVAVCIVGVWIYQKETDKLKALSASKDAVAEAVVPAKIVLKAGKNDKAEVYGSCV